VAVKTYGGTTPDTSADDFTYTLTTVSATVPQMASTISPSGNGSGTSGPQFSIYGSNFGANPTVTIGGLPCVEVSVSSDGTALTCSGPVSGLSAGAKTVWVNGAELTSAVTYDSTNFPTLQSLTSATCSTTPSIYRDTRDSQLYYVAKLADDKCWMLDNLKYKPNGDSSGTATAGFSATQVWSGSLSDSGQYVDPIQSILGASYCQNNTNINANNITKCGFLYNFYTATAGVSQSTGGGVVTSSSICPANWRLPSTRYFSTELDTDFPFLNARMNDPTATTGSASATYYANWHPSGAFQGVFSGIWYSGYQNQGLSGQYWSATTQSATQARAVNIEASSVNVSYTTSRSIGLGVRCVVGG
jgi:uncharacterized protein (TIGR02145 family)